MRPALALLFGMLLGACTAYQPAALVPSPPTYHVASAADLDGKTVALVGLSRSGEVRAYCSGVWVSSSTILTARHCVRDSVVGDVVSYVVHTDVRDEEHITTMRAAHLYAVAELHDLALLRAVSIDSGLVSAPEHGVATVGPRVEQGMFAQTMGAPLGLWYSYSSGDVSAVRATDFGDGPLLWVQSTAPISPGNSGGGLFDEAGRLIGIAHAFLPRGEELNLFVHPQYIEALLHAQALL